MTLTLTDLLLSSVGKEPSRPALHIRAGEDDLSLTYGQLGAWVGQLGAGLRALGVRKGDRVGILSDNHPFWGVAFFGVLWSGGVVIPIDTKLKQQSILNILNHSECKIILVSREYHGMLSELSGQAAGRPVLLDLDTESGSQTRTTLGDLAARFANVPLEPEPLDPDDVAVLLYTSGTMGNPKAVMLTHKNFLSNIESLLSIFPLEENLNSLSILPLCHTYAITADFLAPLVRGGTIHYLESLKGPLIAERMRETQISVLITVPALVEMMIHQIMSAIAGLSALKRFVFRLMRNVSAVLLRLGVPAGGILFRFLRKRLSPRLRFMISGAAPLDPNIIREFFILGLPVYQGYGLTETSPVLTANAPGRNRIGSVGRPIPGVEIRIEAGEIVARGPNIMKGYFKDPDATAQVLKDGWFYTGDAGYLDRSGYLYISGRLKNVIVTRAGKNVYPEGLEEQLCRIPWIKQACVVGVKKRKLFAGDEWVYAVIVADKDAFRKIGIEIEPGRYDPRVVDIMEREIRFLNDRLADYECIRDFEVWDELPMTTTLKVKRAEVSAVLAKRGEHVTEVWARKKAERSGT